MEGRRRTASRETLLAVLRALGVAVESVRDARGALQSVQRTREDRMLEPVHVCWVGSLRRPLLRVPWSQVTRRWQVSWRLEDGEEIQAEVSGGKAREGRERVYGGQRFWETRIPLPKVLVNLPDFKEMRRDSQYQRFFK